MLTIPQHGRHSWMHAYREYCCQVIYYIMLAYCNSSFSNTRIDIIFLCRNEQQVHNLAYCLSLVSPTEKGLLKLQENFCCYKEQLLNTAVHKYLLTYVTKAKKSGKTEMKVQY